MPLPIWGWAGPEIAVAVEFARITATAPRFGIADGKAATPEAVIDVSAVRYFSERCQQIREQLAPSGLDLTPAASRTPASSNLLLLGSAFP